MSRRPETENIYHLQYHSSEFEVEESWDGALPGSSEPGERGVVQNGDPEAAHTGRWQMSSLKGEINSQWNTHSGYWQERYAHVYVNTHVSYRQCMSSENKVT